MLRFVSEYKEILFLSFIVVISALLPHPANITPIGALGLFAGANMRRPGFLLLPAVVAMVADLATVGIYSLLIMFFVYAGHLLSALCGRYLMRDRALSGALPIAAVAASIGFYLVSNIGNWWVYQPHTWAGLVECYTLGLPYLARTLFGNMLYGSLFFGVYALMQIMLERLDATEPA
ncbi:MAG: hypothetical protein DHS20C12_07880 [Pseudohongiella sp.]|nr:MAG: hypothetical protein DHS20C12_07880 [Pseudohongiella sp.]